MKYCFVILILLGTAFPGVIAASTLSLSPATGVYTTGSTFTVRVVVNTKNAPINAADGTLTFNPKELQVVSVSRSASIFNLWTTEPTFSNAAGTINFSGGSPTGYTGSAGTVFAVTFRTLGAGSPRVSLSSGSVLAADGRGTNVLTSMGSGAYTVSALESKPEPEVIVEYVPPANTPAAPSITSETHPDPASWSIEKTAVLRWSLPADVTAVRTLLDLNPTSIPTKVYETPIKEITLPDLPEGISYFHIQFKNADGWGRVTHRRLAIDTTPPSNFKVELDSEANKVSPVQALIATTTDTGAAPIVKFIVQVNNGEPFTVLNENDKINLTNLLPGKQNIVVEAFDAAGNKSTATYSFDIESFDAPTFEPIPSIISSGVVPVFQGRTRPLATLTATLVAVGQQPVTLSATSDETGVFRLIPDGRLQDGVYELSATAVDEFGATSALSATVRFVVQPSGLLRVGNMLISIFSVIIPLFALLLLSGLGMVFLWRRTRRIIGGVRRESDEVITAIESEFAKIEAVLKEKEQLLVASRKTKKLTSAEEDLILSIRTVVTKAHLDVEKEAQDVSNIIHK